MSEQYFNIDVNVNTNGLDQISQIKSSFDSLRNSLSNLDSSVNALNKNQAAYNKQNQEIVTWGTKIKNLVKDLGDNFNMFKGVIESVKQGMDGWAGALSIAFTLITTYGPQVLDFLSDMFQSDKTREAAQSLRDYKAVMEDYISTMSNELSTIQTLVNIANSDKLSKENKLEAIKRLNNVAPEHLNNLTLENIKTKEGKALLDDYIKSLNRKAMLESVTSQKTAYVKQRLNLKNDYKAAKDDWDAYKTGKKKDEIIQEEFDVPGEGKFTTSYSTKERARIKFDKLAKQDASILAQMQKLDKDLAKTLTDYAPNPNIKVVHDRQYWETMLSDQQQKLSKLDASSKSFETQAKAIKSKMVDINKILSGYSINAIKKEKPKSSKPKSPTFNPEAQKQQAAQRLKQTADEFNKYLDQQNNNYDVELGRLKHQLDNKLITQEQYFEDWAKLQDKHHTGIGESIKLFEEQQLAATQQHQRDLVNAEKEKKIASKGEHAILPAQKLEAEKAMITARYEFEIEKAAEAGLSTVEIRERYAKDILDADKRFAEQRKEFELQTAQQVSDAAFSILQNNIKAGSAAKLKQLDTQKTAELSNTSLTGAQKKAIEEKYKKKEAEEKVKAFKAEQRTSILQAVVNGALAITKATAQTGVFAPFVIPAIIASTAIQVATIAAQKAPQYAKGGLHYQSDGKGAVLPGYSRTDNTNAYLRSGEAVVVSEAMRNPWARNLVSAVNVAYGGRDFSVTNPGSGYAIGGIFTDGGNSNRYYNQPMNDQQALANSIAYQMVNNFPPIYVDVKDVNNQQNILAQTVNRVNL